MPITKTLTFVTLMAALVLAGWGCTAEQKVEVPQQEQIEKNLVPAKAQVTGQNFSMNLTDLKVAMTIDSGSKEIVETPKLRGNIKIVNTSQNILDVQGVSLGYLDEAGKPITFKSGEKTARLSSYWKPIKPDETYEASIDTTIPRAAVKEKALGKIQIEMVYVPSPIKRESLSLIERIE